MTSIFLENVSKSYGDTVAVDDVSLQVSDEEFLVFVGPSGCGKSTILRLISGLETVDCGQIYFNGKNVTVAPPKIRDVAMVFQNYALYPHMSVRKNLDFALRMKKEKKETINERLSEVARILGIESFYDRLPSQLSGGQAQRVAMGRAMMRNPQIFLMDEPLSNLDARLRQEIRGELARLQNKLRKTTIFVTHDQEEAMTLGNRVAVVNAGKVQQIDAPREIYKRPNNIFVAKFIGNPAMNFLPATIEKNHVKVGQYDFPLPKNRKIGNLRNGMKVILGIRPSDIEDMSYEFKSNLPSIRVVVETFESLGSEINLTFVMPIEEFGDQYFISDHLPTHVIDNNQGKPQTGFRINARVNSNSRAYPGKLVNLSFDPNNFYFFHPATGNALARNSS